MVAFDSNLEQNIVIDTNLALVLHTTSARNIAENIIMQSKYSLIISRNKTFVMHVRCKYPFKLCTKCTLHGDNLMFRGTAKFTTDTTKVDTINRHINLLKPTGHVMHQQFNIQQLYVLATLYLCVLYLSQNKQRLVPLTA